MRPANVERLLYMRTREVPTPSGGTAAATLEPDEFEERFQLQPDGLNAYFGVIQDAVQRFETTGAAMNDEHRKLFTSAVETLIDSARQEMLIDLSLLPLEKREPFVVDPFRSYDLVDNNLPLVRRLAEELSAFQRQAQEARKQLDIVVRYASEMHDPATEKQPYGRDPQNVVDTPQQERFKTSFRRVREVFREHAPAIRFTFSPAIRSDIKGKKLEVLLDYWPGDEMVDVISCTWFIGQEENLPGGIESMRKYFLHRAGRKLPFGIDEMGGANGDVPMPENERMLARMFEALAELQSEEIAFQYVTIFLDGKWGRDVNSLAFLQS